VKRIFVLLILAFLVLGAAASAYADGADESQTPVLPENAAPEPVQPGEATPRASVSAHNPRSGCPCACGGEPAADPQPRGAVRGYVRGRIHVCVPAPARKQGEWGQCPLCGSTSKAEQELAIWAKVTGVPAEELKKHLSSGVGLGEMCGAVVVARKQGKSLGEVIQQAKNDRVSMRILAYAAGMSLEEFAEEVEALHTAFLEQAVADELVTKDQVAKGREALTPDRLAKRSLGSRKAGVQVIPMPGLGMQYRVMPGLGSTGQRMVWLARMRDMMLMQLRNMMRGPVGIPGHGK